jgi:mannose-1-phosphate guanylyltransferase
MKAVIRPFLDHILYLLRTHGIHDVVLAVAYRSESFEEAYGDGSHLGMSLTYVREEEAMGTGGAIKNVERYLDPGETFLVFNGDVLTDLDLTDMLRFHREHGSICTISLTHVDDPSIYGVVDMDEQGLIQRFTEKPKREEATSNWINAGTYILEPGVLPYIPAGQFYMVEHGLFPTLLREGKPLYGYRTGAYWLDIGTPAKYLQAHIDLLGGRLKYSLAPEGELFTDQVWVGEGTSIEKGARLLGPIVLGNDCSVAAGASVTGPAVIGDGCRIGEEADLSRLVAWNDVVIGPGSAICEAIIAHSARIGGQCRIDGMSVIGDHASISDGSHITAEAKIDPGSAQ